MNEKEEYFRISKKETIHILSDRIPIAFKELMVWSFTSFFLSIFFAGVLAGILIAILTLVGYVLYRFSAWVYYSELQIDEKTGKMTLVKKILNWTQKVELITNEFDPLKFEFSKLESIPTSN